MRAAQHWREEGEETLGAGDAGAHVFEEEQFNAGLLEGPKVELGALDESLAR